MPQEDCGGTWGYGELLEMLADPKRLEHTERLEWVGGPIDPEVFDLSHFAENVRPQHTLGHQAFADLITSDDDSP